MLSGHGRLRVACCEALENRRLMRAGGFDTSFNMTGVSSVPYVSVVSTSNGVQSTGKIIVGGYTAGDNPNFALARFNTDGTVDTTFGSGGVKYSSLGTAGVVLNAIVIQPDDDIVAVGVELQTQTSQSLMIVARYTADGSLDPTFNGGGVDYIHAVDGDINGLGANAVTLQSDGKIVVAGFAGDLGNNNFAVVRINTDGSFDSSFAGDGTRAIDFGQNESANAVTIDYSGTQATNSNYGKVVIVGTQSIGTNSKFAIARLTTGGDLDGSFSGDGKVVTPFVSEATLNKATGVAVQDSGKIVIGGEFEVPANPNVGRVGLFRLNANGLGDSSFGVGNGQTEIDIGNGVTSVSNLLVGESGSLFIGGVSAGTTYIDCLTVDGQIDTNVGTNGSVTVGLHTSLPFPTASLSRGVNGTILVTGASNFATARLFDRAADIVAIASFDPIASETGPDSATFLVTRSRRDSTPLRVYLAVFGTATRPGSFFSSRVDYSGTNIHFGEQRIGEPSYVDIAANETFIEVTITPIDDTTVEGDETASFSPIEQPTTYSVGTPSSVTLVIHDNDIASPPVVASDTFNYVPSSQTVQFSFNQDVGASLGANDFSVTGPNGAVPFTFSYDNVNDLATLSFSGALPDGNYTATAIAAGITNASGTALASDVTLNFFTLAGDVNHDGRVDFSDLLIVAQNYGQSVRTFAQGDLNGDGNVDFGDLLILAQQYNHSLTVTAASVGLRASKAALRLGAMD